MSETSAINRTRWTLAAICALAVILRIIAAVVHPTLDANAYPDVGDYDMLGKAIATGGDYRVPGGIAVRMPGYPLLIGGVYAVLGAKPMAVLMLQALMGAGVCLLAWAVVRRISEPAGLIAAGLAALDPWSIATSAGLLSEAPFALALVGMVALAARLTREPKELSLWIGFGLLAAGAVYLRAAALYLPPAMVAVVLFRRVSVRAVTGAAIVVVMVMASLVPWKLFLNRHPETFGLRGMTSLEGISLYEAVYANATGGVMQGEILKRPPLETLGMNEAERDGWYRSAAWREMRENPGRVARLAPVKFALTWSPGVNAGELKGSWFSVGLWVWHVPLFVLAAAGIFGRRWTVERALVVTPIVYLSLLHMIFLGSVRYRVPLQPLICMLAAVGVCRVAQRFFGNGLLAKQPKG